MAGAAGATKPFSVASILDSIGSTIGEITQEDMQAGGNFDAATAVYKAEQASQEAAARDASAVEAAKQTGVLQKQGRDAAVLQALDYDTLSVQLAGQLRESGDKLQKLDAAISAKRNVNFLDNPVMWLGAQLSAQGDIGSYNSEASRYNLLDERNKKMNDFAQETADTTLRTMTTVTADSAAAAGRLAGVQYQSAAREASIRAMVNDTARLKFMRESSAQQITLQVEGRRVLDAEEDQAMQREKFKLDKEAHYANMANMKRTAEEQGRKKEFETSLLGVINTGAKHLNRKQFATLAEYEVFSASSKGNADLAQQMSGIGYNMLDNEQTGKTGVIRLGEDAGDVAKLLIGVRGSLAQSPAIDKFLKSTYIQVVTGAVPSVPKEDARGYVTRQAALKATEYARDVRAGGADNFYAPPTYGEVIAVIGSEAKLPPLYHKIFAADAKANPTQRLDPAALYHRTVEAVASGKVTLNEAIDGLNQLGNIAVDTNNTVRGYDAVGIAKQSSFATKTKLVEGSYFDREINLSNRADLAAKLAIAASLKKFRNSGSIGLPEIVKGTM